MEGQYAEALAIALGVNVNDFVVVVDFQLGAWRGICAYHLHSRAFVSRRAGIGCLVSLLDRIDRCLRKLIELFEVSVTLRIHHQRYF